MFYLTTFILARTLVLQTLRSKFHNCNLGHRIARAYLVYLKLLTTRFDSAKSQSIYRLLFLSTYYDLHKLIHMFTHYIQRKTSWVSIIHTYIPSSVFGNSTTLGCAWPSLAAKAATVALAVADARTSCEPCISTVS